MSEVLVYPSHLAASRALAERVVRISEIAVAVRDRFTLALSGGNTPRLAYDLLSSEFSSLMDWDSTFVFWSDERGVPPEAPESNVRMAREALLNHVPMALNHIFRIHGERPPEQAAADYEEVLREFFARRGQRVPRFDALLLGLGADGHIASLLPGSPALDEDQRWVTTAARPEEPFSRITLTYPALNSAAHVLLLVTGPEKAEVVARVIHGDIAAGVLPAHRLAPADGSVVWILDEAAAVNL